MYNLRHHCKLLFYEIWFEIVLKIWQYILLYIMRKEIISILITRSYANHYIIMFLINGCLIVNLKINDSLNELNAWIKRITSFCCLLKFYRLFKNNKELKIVTCNNMWLFNKTERKFLAIIVSINALFIRVNYIKMYVNTCVWIIYYEIQLFK